MKKFAAFLLILSKTESFRLASPFSGFVFGVRRHQIADSCRRSTAGDEKVTSLDYIAENLSSKLKPSLKEMTRMCKVQVAPVPLHRLGLVATQSISKGDVVVAVPYDDRFELSSRSAAALFQGILPDDFDSWTGDAGLIALQILNEVFRKGWH